MVSYLQSVEARHSSASNEHYTPHEIVECARTSLGRIDLDPFSCALANTIVRAEVFFSLDDNGADRGGWSRTWNGRVFCNPPGGKEEGHSNQKHAWFKLASEYKAGRVASAVFVCFSVELLQTTQVKTPPGLAIPLDFPICYPRARLAYLTSVLPGPTPKNQDRKPTKKQIDDHTRTGLCTGESPPHSSCVIFLPDRGGGIDGAIDRESVDRFRRAFSPIGRVK